MKPFALRLLVAVLLAVILGLLALLALPRPGVRITALRPVDTPASAVEAPDIPPRVRLATYNLEHFYDGYRDGVDRTPEAAGRQVAGAAAIIASVDPDILMLQEIENPAMLQKLNEALPIPYPYAYITRYIPSRGAPDTINDAMLSRLNPREVRQISFHKLPHGRRPSRGALAARFSLAPGRDLLVYDMHLKSNYGKSHRNIAQRSIALHLLAADAAAERYRTAEWADLSVVLVGDTNVDPDVEEFADDPSLHALAGGYTDLWLGRPIEERTTIPTRHPGPDGDTNLVFRPAAFDRIFASKDLTTPAPPPPECDASVTALVDHAGELFPLLPAPRYAISAPVALPRGCATNDNRLQPGFGGHVTDHYLVYADITPAN